MVCCDGKGSERGGDKIRLVIGTRCQMSVMKGKLVQGRLVVVFLGNDGRRK